MEKENSDKETSRERIEEEERQSHDRIYDFTLGERSRKKRVEHHREKRKRKTRKPK